MKKLLFILILISPIEAFTHDLYSSFRIDNKCYGKIYREKYIQGNAKKNGYVHKWTETMKIPCNQHQRAVQEDYINKNKYNKFVKEKFISIRKWFNRKFADWKLKKSRDYKN